MLYGLFNASASFHDYTNKIMAEKLEVFFIAYLDDIVISTNEADDINFV